MRKILLIMIGLSMVLYADFSKSGDVVIDSKTALQWQDDSDAGTGTKSWQEAIDYCEALILGAKSDWRLPNINELKSLVDDTKYNPSIDSTFQNVASSNYWSSTTSVNGDGNAWFVNFRHGYQSNYYGTKNYNYYVRCVRAGQ